MVQSTSSERDRHADEIKRQQVSRLPLGLPPSASAADAHTFGVALVVTSSRYHQVQISESKAAFEVEKITLKGDLDKMKRKKIKAEEKLKETGDKGSTELAELEDELEELC